MFSLYPHVVKETRDLCRVSFIRALISFVGAPLSWPNYLPKAPSPNVITWAIRMQHMNLWETGKIDSNAGVSSDISMLRNRFLATLSKKESLQFLLWHSGMAASLRAETQIPSPAQHRIWHCHICSICQNSILGLIRSQWFIFLFLFIILGGGSNNHYGKQQGSSSENWI